MLSIYASVRIYYKINLPRNIDESFSIQFFSTDKWKGYVFIGLHKALLRIIGCFVIINIKIKHYDKTSQSGVHPDDLPILAKFVWR